ncbi:hypothetical protein [Aureliella helgolandensis]|uniref:Transmembrane protein n=1 Tax=Aureliella helgolandensis TaxID=2527968 RepID=A0A518G2B2_9BACT|nr:hypothetical protein [Aureliella helgolandensis]QDV22722.1 hypothetical protein Q31a_10080 [Aureliella helgolandensis]
MTHSVEETPFEDRHIPRVEISWDRSAWWWYPLTRAIHPAMRAFALVLSLVAILVAVGGWRLGDWLLSPAWQASGQAIVAAPTAFSWQLGGALERFFSEFQTFEQFGIRELGFVTFQLVWQTLTFALFGGVIARRGAVELGQRTVAAWGESVRLVSSRWASYLWSSGMHLVGICALLIPVFLLGVVARFGAVGATIGAVGVLACFPLVFAIGRMVVSAVVGFPLSVVAISLERKADAFEGFSRSNAYFFQRPIEAAICILALLAIGSVGGQLVFWSLHAGWFFVSHSFVFTAGGVTDASRFGLVLGGQLTEWLVAAYWFSFFWTGAAATYLILRKSVDHTELDEMELLESPIEESLPAIPTAAERTAASTTTPPSSTDQDATSESPGSESS